MDSVGREDFLKKSSDNIFIFAVILIFLITIASFYQFKKLTKTNNWVTHTYEVILTANHSMYYYNYLEAKQREYLLFNDAEALQNFQANVAKINTSLNQLTQLTIDNPNQQKKIQNYVQVINERLTLLNQAIGLKQVDQYTAEKKKEIFSRGKVLSTEIDNIAQEIINQEKLLLQERNTRLLEEINIVNYVTTFGQVLSIIFLIIAFIVSHRQFQHRLKEQEQLKLSYQKLNAATDELKNKNDKITLLLEMSDILLVTDSLDELSQVIPKYCNKILSFSSGNFYIMHPSKDILEISAKWGAPAINTEIFTPNQCWALRLGRIQHSLLKPNDLLCAHVQSVQEKDLGYVCLPLRAQNDVFGLLYIEYDVSNDKQLSDTEKILINAFAEVIALALANARLRDNLRYQSIRDPLTTLYNRRYLEEFLTRQLFLAQREHKPLTVVILDLDHFKRVNDVHGHDAGDVVLKEFSSLILKFVRRSDLAARFGGEEFVVILYNANKEGGKKRAEELRKAVSQLYVKYGNQDIHLTVSLGLSSFPENAKEGKDLIELADKALYAAKKNGRNQVVHYDEISELIPT